MLKLVLFDMDGLMVNTEALVFDIWSQVFAENGLDMTLERYITVVGRKDAEIYDMMQDWFPNADMGALISQCRDRLAAHIVDRPIDVKPGLFELLDELDRRNIKKAFATSSEARHADRILTRCGILPRLDGGVSGDMVENGKPDPAIFLLGATRMGEPPKDCLVLEDSDPGIFAAHAAGIRVVCVKDLKPPSQEAAALCFAVVDSLHDVIGLLDKI